MNCPFCKSTIKDASTFCSRCGKKIPHCPTCGSVIEKPQKYCTNDGTLLPEDLLSLFPSFSPDKSEEAENVQKEDRKRQYCVKCGKPCASESKYCIECQPIVRNDDVTTTSSFCVECGKPCEGDLLLCAECQQKKKKKAGGKRTSLWIFGVLLLIAVVGITGFYLYKEGKLPAQVNDIVKRWMLQNRDEDEIYESNRPAEPPVAGATETAQNSV